MNMMLLQSLQVHLFYIFFLLMLIILSLTITIALRRVPPLFGEEGSETLRAWWQWLNRPDPLIRKATRHAPGYLLDQKVESWLCPICGSMLSKQDVHQLEIGYDIECGYCGAIISPSRVGY